MKQYALIVTENNVGRFMSVFGGVIEVVEVSGMVSGEEGKQFNILISPIPVKTESEEAKPEVAE